MSYVNDFMEREYVWLVWTKYVKDTYIKLYIYVKQILSLILKGLFEWARSTTLLNVNMSDPFEWAMYKTNVWGYIFKQSLSPIIQGAFEWAL